MALEENGKVIVTGCLGKGPKSHVIREKYPDVLSITGPQDYAGVMGAVHAAVPPAHDPFLDLLPAQGIKLTPKHYAYVKIAEGCNHKCSFCIIPSMRGRLASRPINEVLVESEKLVKAGVQELLVISQDTSAYGSDLKYAPGSWRGREYQTRFLDLCKGLGELGAWVRLHYVYPYPHVDDVIPLMAEGKVLPYLDVPFQHGSPKILKAMKRPAAAEDTLERLAAWRKICPDLTVRSTFIVGFPGETEDDFQQLLDFLEEVRFDRVGAFTYSPQEGTRAYDMVDDVPDVVKRERLERLTELQREITAERYEERIGRVVPVLVDRAATDEEPAMTRAPWQADDVDGVTWVDTDAVPGSFVEVEIDEVVDDYDFAATARRVIDAPAPAARRSRALPMVAGGSTVGSFGR